MCFKRKKNLIKEYSTQKSSIETNTTYKIGQFVHFRYRDELYFGYVNWIYKGTNNEILYDIQVGGQCPAIIKGIREDIIFIMEERKNKY